MKKLARTFGLGVILWVSVLVPRVAQASNFQQGDALGVQKDQSVTGNHYFIGQSVSIDGTVDGDVVVFANSVTITGLVKGSVLGIANQVEVKGTVNGSIRTISSVLHLTSDVGADLTAVAAQLSVDQSAHVHGLTAFLSSQPTLLGHLDGSVYDVLAEQQKSISIWDIGYRMALTFLAWSLLGVMLYSLQGYLTTESLYYGLRTRFFRHFSIGLVTSLLGGIVVLLLLLSGIGRILGILVLAVCAVCLVLAVVDSAYALGRTLFSRQQPVPNHVIILFLLGNLVLTLLLQIPIVLILPLFCIIAAFGNRLIWFLSKLRNEPLTNE